MRLVGQMAHTDGIVYLRTTRGAYPVIYRLGRSSQSAGARSTGPVPGDQVALIGAGVTLHECLARR